MMGQPPIDEFTGPVALRRRRIKLWLGKKRGIPDEAAHENA
jgi:hypothetical protein